MEHCFPYSLSPIAAVSFFLETDESRRTLRAISGAVHNLGGFRFLRDAPASAFAFALIPLNTITADAFAVNAAGETFFKTTVGDL